MSLIKTCICARYVEELIDFFMKKNTLICQPFRFSENAENIPVLFTQEIGSIVSVISDCYQHRQKVETSELCEYFLNEELFYNHVSLTALDYLNKTEETNFFHMSAYVAEVAVFCQRQNFPHMQGTLIAALTCLLDEHLNLDLEKTRLYYQKLAKGMDKARIERVLSEVKSESENQLHSNENQVVNSMVYSCESSCVTRNKCTVLLPSNHAANSTQVQRHVLPDIVNGFSGQSFPHHLLPRYPSFSVAEVTVSGYTYPNVLGAQFIPVRNPVPRLDSENQQQVPEFLHHGSRPSATYHSKLQSNFDASQVPKIAESFSDKTPDFTSSFSRMSLNNSARPSSTKNSKCDIEFIQRNQKLHTLNVNAPAFVHSSVKPAADSSMTESREKLPENNLNTKSSSNEILSEMSN